MTEDLNQFTLNCLISKDQLQKLNKKTEKNTDEKNKEMQEYSERIKMLFDDLLVCRPPEDLLIEVQSAFQHFIRKSIYYLKLHDETEKIERERNNDVDIHDDIDYDKDNIEYDDTNTYKKDKTYINKSLYCSNLQTNIEQKKTKKDILDIFTQCYENSDDDSDNEIM